MIELATLTNPSNVKVLENLKTTVSLLKLRNIILKETPENCRAKIFEDKFEMRVLQLGWMMHCRYCNYVAQIPMKQVY